jgi:ArpU family phage transcriptional regulator
LNDFKRKIERVLYSYPALLAAQENERELEASGLGNLFPAMVASYSGMPNGGGISNPTEKYAVMRAEKILKIRQIERGIYALTYTERDLIQLKYFNPAQPKDADVYEQIGLGSTNYYKTKERALRKMAIALNMI